MMAIYLLVPTNFEYIGVGTTNDNPNFSWYYARYKGDDYASIMTDSDNGYAQVNAHFPLNEASDTGVSIKEGGPLVFYAFTAKDTSPQNLTEIKYASNTITTIVNPAGAGGAED